MKTSVSLIVLFVLSTFFEMSQESLPTIAVANPNINSLETRPEIAAKMMRLELIKMNKYKVYDEFDMNEIIQTKEEYKSGCYGQNCLTRLGEELKVDYVMSGSIDGLGNKIVVTVKIIDVKKVCTKAKMVITGLSHLGFRNIKRIPKSACQKIHNKKLPSWPSQKQDTM